MTGPTHAGCCLSSAAACSPRSRPSGARAACGTSPRSASGSEAHRTRPRLPALGPGVAAGGVDHMFGQWSDDWLDRLWPWLWFVDVGEDLFVVVDDPLPAACAIAAPPTPRLARAETVARASRSRFRMVVRLLSCCFGFL